MLEKISRKQYKDRLIERLDFTVSTIEARIADRKTQFDYENSIDEEKLNELKLQKEGLHGLK